MEHFVIVSYLFCSENTIGSRRWREMAALLREVAQVTVICADGSSISDERIRVIRVIDSANTMPVRNGFVARAPNNWLLRQTRHLAQSFLFWPDRQYGWACRAISQLDELLQSEPANYVITTGPRFSIHTAMARWVRRNPGKATWIMDLRDPWTNDPAPGMQRRTPAILTRIEARMERACHQTADLVTTIGDTMTEMVKRDFDSPAITIYNGYPDNSHPKQPSQDEEPRPTSICYLGTIIHGLRTPALLFRAAQQMALKENQLRFEFWCNDPGAIRAEAARCAVEHLVTCHSAIGLEQSHRIQRLAGANLVLNGVEDHSNHMLTGKVFELIAAEQPIIAVTGPRSELRSILENCQCNGLVWDLPTAIRAVEAFLNKKLNPVRDSMKIYSRRAALSKLMTALANTR